MNQYLPYCSTLSFLYRNNWIILLIHRVFRYWLNGGVAAIIFYYDCCQFSSTYVLDCYQKALIGLNLHYIPAIFCFIRPNSRFEFIALCLDFKICFLCLKVCNDMVCIRLLLIDCDVEDGYCVMNVWNCHLIMFRGRGVFIDHVIFYFIWRCCVYFQAW